MELDLTGDQNAIVDAFGSFFSRECPPDLVRRHAALGHDPQLWQRFAAMGGAGMSLPADVGGGGAGLLEAVLVAEQAGRVLAPLPLVEHLAAGRLLSRTSRDAARLEEVANGGRIATVALAPVGTGALLVPAGAVADTVVMFDIADQQLVAVDEPPPMSATPNIGDAPLAVRELRAGATVLATGEDAVDHFGRACDEWRLLTAAALVGLSARALEIGVDYVATRHQFGVPVGSFQAVQHGLAELPGQLNGARLLAQKAAWAVDHGSADASRLAAMAFLFAGRTARVATARALHYHGGYGVMDEYDIELYFRRARGWANLLGDPHREIRHLADIVLGPVESGH